MRNFAALLLLIYIGGYIGYRQIFTEVWEKDKASYVIFSEGDVGTTLYYLWRPMSYADAKITGVGAHIGQHQQ